LVMCSSTHLVIWLHVCLFLIGVSWASISPIVPSKACATSLLRNFQVGFRLLGFLVFYAQWSYHGFAPKPYTTPVNIPLCTCNVTLRIDAPSSQNQVGPDLVYLRLQMHKSNRSTRDSYRNTGIISKIRRPWELNLRPATWGLTTYPLH